MRDSQDPGGSQRSDELIPGVAVWHPKVVHVERMLAAARRRQRADAVRSDPPCYELVVPLEYLPAPPLNFVPRLELSVQEGGQQIGQHVAGPDIVPGVFVDLS